MSALRYLAMIGLLLTSALQAAAPKVTQLFPAGAQRGESTLVTAAGEFSSWPVDVWCDQPGVQVVAEAEKGKLRVTIAADARPGLCWLRFYNQEGAANLRPFFIDQLPEMIEVEPNKLPDQVKKLPLPIIINGKLDKRHEVDNFAVALTQGQTLVASLQAQYQLGSPMDSILQVCERIERKTSSVAGAPVQYEAYVLEQNHDARGLDPLIIFTAPRDGVYLVRTFAFPSEPNGTIAFSGEGNYIYRLTLTTGPAIDHALPLSHSRTTAGEVKLFGWNLPSDSSSAPLAALEAAEHTSADTVILPSAAGTATVRRTPSPGVLADAEANTPAGQLLSLPTIVSGRFTNPGEKHTYRFAATKGQKLKLEVGSREFGFPLDGVLVVEDAAGKQLHRVDDDKKQADPELVFTAPADGEYRVRLADLHDRGGLRFVYQLAIQPVTADYALTVAGDAFLLAKDKPLEIPVTIDRRDGLENDIAVSLTGLPEGLTCDAVTSAAKGDTAKTVKLIVKAADSAVLPWNGPVTIRGQVADQPQLERHATFSTNLPGVGPQTHLWLTASKP